VSPGVAEGAAAPAGGLRAVLAAIDAARAAGRRIALAVVAQCEGSTYRKPGALVAVDASGRASGTLSGGCLEPELQRIAAEVLATDGARALDFDTRGDDDLVFGSGSGCRGRMRVVVLPIDPQRDAELSQALGALARRDGVLPAAVVHEGPHAGAMQLRDRAQAIGRAPAELAPLLAGIAAGRVREVALARGGTVDRAQVLHLCPPPRLLLLGAGPEAPPLARIAREIGWRVDAGDHRPALLDRARLPADALHPGRPAAVLAALADARLDAVVVMTHGASADLEALRALAQHPVAHVALLGPPARRDELLAAIDPAARAALLPRLQAPAGLALGGEGPEAIALSIAAGLPHRR
jgi:xanthine dehydrogenase accessory factor